MRRWFPLSILCLFMAFSAWGEEDNRSGEVVVPDSMEIIKKGDVNVLVPKGQSLVSDSSFFVTENPDEYASRKFIEAEARADKMDKELAALKDDLEDVKKTVESLKQERDDSKKVDI